MIGRQDVILLALAVILVFAPLVINRSAAFEGTDDQAKEVIVAINPDYKPWMEAIWEPPSGEVESFLFALQAAIGAGFIGYFFGFQRGRKAIKGSKREQNSSVKQSKLGLNE